MTLTLGTGPLASGAPDTTNYFLDGPQHKLLFSPFSGTEPAGTFDALGFEDGTAVVPLLHEGVAQVALLTVLGLT